METQYSGLTINVLMTVALAIENGHDDIAEALLTKYYGSEKYLTKS